MRSSGVKTFVDVRGQCLQRQLLCWTGTDPNLDEPFLDVGADDIRMIFLQVVNARTSCTKVQFFNPFANFSATTGEIRAPGSPAKSSFG